MINTSMDLILDIWKHVYYYACEAIVISVTVRLAFVHLNWIVLITRVQRYRWEMHSVWNDA